MERIAQLHIERLPEGVYLATSDDIPGLVAQGRTVTETIEIARDVARKLIDAQTERTSNVSVRRATSLTGPCFRVGRVSSASAVARRGLCWWTQAGASVRR